MTAVDLDVGHSMQAHYGVDKVTKGVGGWWMVEKKAKQILVAVLL